MQRRFNIDIREVVELLGLKVDPKSSLESGTFNVQCPFCQDRKYHMNINAAKNAYSCVLCSKDKGQGALDLYARVVHGTRCVKGVNSKELYHELCEALHHGDVVQAQKPARRHYTTSQAIKRASDEVVGSTYEKLLEFRPFALSLQHRENLHKRGFTDEAIIRNQYRSIVRDFEWLKKYPSSRKLYHQVESLVKNVNDLQKKSEDEIVAGLALSSYLLSCGCTLKGVPGFYKLGDFWCFNIVEGMIIPTRNIDGRVVALQVRRDKPSYWDQKCKGRKFLRYLTISSKGLPEGVTEGISRAHFPLNNPPLTKETSVCITEGPLKADAAIELAEESNVFFVALHGTMNTKELPGFFKRIRSIGISRIENVFDMDKTTNPNVANAGKSIWKKAKDAGLSVAVRCWDEEYARVKCRELSILCAENDLFVPTALNVFVDIAAMARALEAAGIQHSVRLLPDGTEEKHYWRNETKGIDDFLLLKKKTPELI